jgi:hypothetical protein
VSKNKNPDLLWRKLISGEVLQTYNNEDCIAQDFISYSTGMSYEDSNKKQIAPPKHDYFEPEMIQPNVSRKRAESKIITALTRILDHIESDECKSYEEIHCENQEAELIPTNKLKKGHIYTEIRKVRDWIDNRK